MFLCTRQIDIHARFGIQRIAFLSLVATIFTFLVSYEVMYYFLDTPLSDRHFFVLIVFILLMYPIHKIVHLLFFLPYYKSFKIHKLSSKKWVPYFNTYVNTPVHLSIYLPQYGHYFMFLLSLNIGCSMMDILYLKILLFSNDGHYVEEHQSGLHILNKVDNPYTQH
ncbi:MAG: DUF3267 domain-containing protein [Staphylococcus epidermidis]|nr:DUF3267 domain-containing protein [Staphylococcus epidermidis]